jgi:hypothetical protein
LKLNNRKFSRLRNWAHHPPGNFRPYKANVGGSIPSPPTI